MAADALSTATTKLDSAQVSKASKALLKHIAAEKKSSPTSTKKNLLADADDRSGSEEPEDEIALWLILTTKKHIIDKNRLKPGKIAIPHSLNISRAPRIILITGEPQRQFKNLVAHPSFPATLRDQVARVIDVGKLKAKFKSYEMKRQLVAEYDVFLAEDRVIPSLPKIMGKVLFQSTAKRPIPVRLVTGKDDEREEAKQAVNAAREIEKALNSALVHLSPNVSTAIKIGYASWTPQKVQENVEAVIPALVENYVPKKWDNVKSIHIKGPETAALPIYMSEKLWVDEADILEQPIEPKPKEKKIKGSKRPLLKDAPEASASLEKAPKKEKKRKATEGDDLDKEIATRKAKLKKQKAEAMGKNAVEA